MAEQSSRPFYGEYVWAFDLLIDRPVGQECAAITAWFRERGVPRFTLDRRIDWSPWLSCPACHRAFGYAGVALLILVVTLLASALPTLRAARSSPLDALRIAQ